MSTLFIKETPAQRALLLESIIWRLAANLKGSNVANLKTRLVGNGYTVREIDAAIANLKTVGRGGRVLIEK